MKKNIIILGVVFLTLCCIALWVSTHKSISASKLIDLVQSNYESIQVNDKIINKNKDSYLIDDFISKLSRYTIKEYDDEIKIEPNITVEIHHKNGYTITLLDNSYIIIDDVGYQILDGRIDLNKFYRFIE